MNADFEFDQAIQILIRAGMSNPLRVIDLIRESIAFFELDLSGLDVLTEAASGPFVVTPILAALSGANRVFALTRDSSYATADAVIEQTRALQVLTHAPDTIQISTERRLDWFKEADIVTNLGFVRPLDRQVIDILTPGTVIPLMCEAWEFRPGDLDIEACRSKQVHVLGTNEDFPGLEVFTFSGILCIKMLLQEQIEIHKSKINVVSSDKFGPVIAKALRQAGATITVFQNAANVQAHEWQNADAVVVADYTRSDWILASNGDLDPHVLADLKPGITIIQFAGRNNVNELMDCGIHVFPSSVLPAHRMAETLAGLGPRPVIDLHTAGLKVGELIYRRDRDSVKHASSTWDKLVQLIQ